MKKNTELTNIEKATAYMECLSNLAKECEHNAKWTADYAKELEADADRPQRDAWEMRYKSDCYCKIIDLLNATIKL